MRICCCMYLLAKYELIEYGLMELAIGRSLGDTGLRGTSRINSIRDCSIYRSADLIVKGKIMSINHPKCCDIERTVCVYSLRYREKREPERRDLYMREVCPTTSPATGELHIHATQVLHKYISAFV